MSTNRTRTRQSLIRVQRANSFAFSFVFSLAVSLVAPLTASLATPFAKRGAKTGALGIALAIMLGPILGGSPAAAEDTAVDAKFRESVKTYLSLQGSVEQMGLSVAYNAANETLMAIAQTGVEITEPMQNIVLEQAIETYASRFGDIEFLTDLWAPIYAKHYTQKEIQTLIDFYRSPIGKKSLELFGPINEEGMTAIQESVFAITPGFQLGVNAKLEAAGIATTPGGPGAPAKP